SASPVIAAAAACARGMAGAGAFSRNSRFSSSTLPELGNTGSATCWGCGLDGSSAIGDPLGQALDPLDHPRQAVAALGADELVEADPPEERLHVERQDVRRALAGEQFLEDRDQAADDLGVGVGGELDHVGG